MTRLRISKHPHTSASRFSKINSSQYQSAAPTNARPRSRHIGEPMILPKLSAALLSMSFFGSAYACSDLHGNTSLDQWIVICGAANGAAATFHALPDELVLHYQTSKNHISRYATEKGMPALEFEPLFEQGRIEGQRLISHRI